MKAEVSIFQMIGIQKNSTLWSFNLHYFNYLCAEKSLEKINLALTLKNEWVKGNPYGVGIGWHPYTISIRLINFYKGAVWRS